jgi:predicted esterase
MTRRALVLLAAGTLAAATLPLHAQSPAPAAPANPQAVVTRADLALAYLAFDRALTAHPPAADKLGPLSQRFDQSTLAFFGGKNADAVRGIHAVTAELQAPGAAASVSPFAIRATVEPHVYRRTLGGPVTLRVVPLYPFADSGSKAPTRFGVRVVSDGGRILAGATVSVAADFALGVPIEVPLPNVSSSTPKGRYRVIVTVAPPGASEPAAPAPTAVPASEWFVTDDDLEAKREEFLRRAAPLDSLDSPALADAAATLKARIRTLTTRPSPANTTAWRANPLALAAEIEFELQTITNGADPYTNRSGSLWRVLRTAARSIPLRTYVPVAVARDKAPAPLLIAIHGVGGDENMFPDALGDGLIVKLAERHGFVVASPNGDQFTTPEDFDRLVEQMSEQVAIDKRRIWIVGHSRGAGQALALAKARGPQIAGVVAIAGLGRVTADAPLPPILAFLGELDPLAAPARMVPLAEQAKAAGVNLEARVMPKLGHTTVVSAVLVDAVAWLLPRTLPPSAPERR